MQPSPTLFAHTECLTDGNGLPLVIYNKSAEFRVLRRGLDNERLLGADHHDASLIRLERVGRRIEYLTGRRVDSLVDAPWAQFNISTSGTSTTTIEIDLMLIKALSEPLQERF